MAAPDDTIYWPRHAADPLPRASRPPSAPREPVPTIARRAATWLAIGLLSMVTLVLDLVDAVAAFFRRAR